MAKDSYPRLHAFRLQSKYVATVEPFGSESWAVWCQCGLWEQGGYDSEANARRGLSQHQARRHPSERG